jgi:hypothetical protein
MPIGSPRPTAGRPKGGRNKMTAAAIAKAEESGLMPLDYMLDVLRNGTDPALRMDAAKAAAPYVHARLSQVDAKVEGDMKHEVTWLSS